MRRRAILRGVLAAVSPLCSSRQGAMAGDALRLPPCPLRLPLLFPKNLAALRFSGTLIIFKGTPVIERRETSPSSVYSQGKKGKSVIFPFLSVWRDRGLVPIPRASAQERTFCRGCGRLFMPSPLGEGVLRYAGRKRGARLLSVILSKRGRAARTEGSLKIILAQAKPRFCASAPNLP